MRLDLAMGLKIGDIVYNAFMDQLVITSRFDQRDNVNNKLWTIVFGTVNTKLYSESYPFDDLYFKDLEGESDEEKSFVNWAKDNRDFFEDSDCLHGMKECYKQGYAMGFHSKLQYSYEEQMQK
jgi:hypothetical protein